MTRRPGGRAARGMTLIEVMAAGAILLVALVGFVATGRYAATANAVGHRRTTTTFLRGDLMDRLTVSPRSGLTTLAGYTGAGAFRFVVDACYDIDGSVLTRNTGWASSSFDCDANAVYRSKVAAKDAGDFTWNVRIYVERLSQGCTDADRYSSIGCSAADLLLTD